MSASVCKRYIGDEYAEYTVSTGNFDYSYTGFKDLMSHYIRRNDSEDYVVRDLDIRYLIYVTYKHNHVIKLSLLDVAIFYIWRMIDQEAI